MAGKTTKVEFDLFARDKASPVFDKFGNRVRQTARETDRLSVSVVGMFKAFAGYEIVSKATEIFKDSIKEARESQKVGAQTAAVIKSTGGAARLTAKDFGNLANQISLKTGIDDEQIQAGENMLATFTQVQNRLGKGNDIFTQATKVAIDFGVATHKGPVEASLMLGKALNNPVLGLAKLTKAGVTFTDQQKAQVAQMVKAGNIAGAQKIILRELTKEYGGSAAAQATAGEKAKVAFLNMEEALGKKLLPQIDKLEVAFVDKAVPALNEFGAWFDKEGAPLLKAFAEDAVHLGQDALPAISTALDVTVASLKVLAPLVENTLGAFDGLPDVTKDAVLLGAAIAFIGPKVDLAATKMRTFAAETTAANVKSAALKVGVGAVGLGLVTFGSQMKDSNLAVSQASTILGDAAVGFSVGGPWGAAVGGAVGILNSFRDANKHAVPDVDSLTASLDTQTGALTRNTKNLITNALQKDGAFKKARQLGVSGGDVVDAAAGSNAAIARIRKMRDEAAAAAAALAEAQSPGSGAAQSAGVKRQFDILLASIGAQRDSVKDDVQAWHDLHDAQAASKELNKLTAGEVDKVSRALKGVPKSVITKFTQPGYKNAEQNIVNIARRYHLNPKQVTTAMRALDYTKPQIAAVIAAMKRVDGLVAHPKIHVSSNAAAAARQAQRDINGVRSSYRSINVMSKKADGGAITGIGGPRDDNILIAASNGEHMLDAQDVKAMGGQKGVYDFRARLHSASRMADGGAVGSSQRGSRFPEFDMRAFAKMLAQENAKALDGVSWTLDRRGNLQTAIRKG